MLRHHMSKCTLGRTSEAGCGAHKVHMDACDKLLAVADLLQDDELKESPPWHTPFHRTGTGPSPSSPKLFDSGQIPISKTTQ